MHASCAVELLMRHRELALGFIGGICCVSVYNWLSKPSYSCGSITLDSDCEEELKLVMVVNASLKMGKGKIGAQCGHAVMAASQGIADLIELPEDVLDPAVEAFNRWREIGQRKVCLKAQSTDEMMELHRRAKIRGLNSVYIRDAGRTQIKAGSVTVLAIGPASDKIVDPLTGHLKLL